MVRYCSVHGCKENTKKTKNRRFFRFPNDELRCRRWIEVIGRMDLECKGVKILNSSYFVCELHFADYDRPTKYLRGDAVPTLQLVSSTTKYTQTEGLPSCSCQLQISAETPSTSQTAHAAQASKALSKSQIEAKVADVRRKWSHIRNSYSRHLRNEMHGACTSKGRMVSRWYLADELEFLREHMATDMRPPTYPPYAPTLLEMDLNESPSSEPVEVKPFIPSPWFAINAPHSPGTEPKLPSIHNEDSSSSTFAPDENTSYFQFFRGIHNDYSELPPKKQRLFKRKCLTLLHELLDDEESNRQIDYSQDNVLNLSNSGHVSEEDRDVKPTAEDGYILPNN